MVAAGAICGRWSPDQSPDGLLNAPPNNPVEGFAPLACGRNIAFAGRLDNRAELAGQLAIPASPTPPNKVIIEQGWNKWGADLPSHLSGDFALAAIKANNRRLFLARDHHGTGQMFFQQQGRSLLFSSSLSELLSRLNKRPQPNKRQVAQLLAAVRFGKPEETMFENVYQVPPGHQLEFDGAHWTLHRYWNPRDCSRLPAGSRRDYNEAFLEVLSAAIRNRLEDSQSPAISLSGGLDSTAIAAVAAEQLARTGRRIDSYTAVPSLDIPLPGNQVADERALVKKLHARYDSITPHWLNSADVSLLGSMDRALDILSEPIFAAANCYWVMDLMQQLEAHGNDVLLTGQCGNATISWPGNRTQHLKTLWRTHGYTAWREEVASFQRAHGLSLATSIRKFVLPTVLGDETVERLKRRSITGKGLEEQTALSPSLGKKLEITRMARSALHMPMSRHHPDFRDAVLLSGAYSPGGTTAVLAAAHGVEHSDPSADKALIEFCFALPESHYVEEGANKRLVRDGMSGLVPEEILHSGKHGVQAADIIYRVRREHAGLTTALAALQASSLAQECLNLTLMESVLQRALTRDDAATASSTRQILLRGIMAGRFLQRFER